MMKKVILSSIILFSTAGIVFSGDSLQGLSPGGQVAVTTGRVYNPLTVGITSALLPGAGQFYSKHYLKAGTIVALEAITASVASYFFKTSHGYSDDVKSYRQFANVDTGYARSDDLEKAAVSRFSELGARYRAYNSLSWLVGGYFFNILDAVDGTGAFKNPNAKSPLIAGWLSAIPGLGLGQMYNGSLSKAGMVIMAQVSLGVVAYDYHKLMKKAESNYARIKTQYNESPERSVIESNYLDDWESRRSNAFQMRNTYLWYSIFFYLYGIFDAVVDAHLHDYPDKMKVIPDLVPKNGGAQLNFNVNF
jgi:TM2 domain-containing membrane protein YozV